MLSLDLPKQAASLRLRRLLLFLLASVLLVATTTAVGSSSLLVLDAGLNISLAAVVGTALNFTTLAQAQSGKNLHAIPGAAKGDIFLPLLSSPGFNVSFPYGSSGFSLGVYLSGVHSYLMYLAVCGGYSGHWSDSVLLFNSSPNVNLAYGFTSTGHGLGSYAMPLWVANKHKPLPVGYSSLLVSGSEAPSHGNVLQLQDPSGAVVWSVENVGMMEIQDTGNLVIYDSINKSRIVWQSLSQPRDTLIQGQKLTVGMELISKDSAYTARMEEGGLVVYLNKVRFIEQPAAYWVIPSFSLSLSKPVITRADLKRLVLESRCRQPHEPAYMVLELDRSFDAGPTIHLKSAQCTQLDNLTGSAILVSTPIWSPAITWWSLTLKNDGRLHINAVDATVYPLVTTTVVVDKNAQIAFVDWGDCAAPMACGPLGICTPFAASPCACPRSSQGGADLFQFIDSTDFSSGCTLVTPLPKCMRGDEHIGTTDYLQLKETSSTFLFGGWPFASTTSASGEAECRTMCSSNCSCTGFFYEATTSACFFMTDGIGLLHTVSRNKSIISDVNSLNGTVLASDFMTYLKINASPLQKISMFKIGMASASSVVACILILGMVLYFIRAKKSKRKARAWDKAQQEEEEELLRDILPLLPSRFLYDDLHKATDGFSKLLGAGGCGSVYAGVLSDGRRVAVKMLEAGMLKSQQSKQFLAEVATVGRTSHHNIVGLVGFCLEAYHRLLVYEYMERGSLDQWLFPKATDDAENGGARPAHLLDWQTRHKVALGIARGLSYLHEDCPQPILHFDIKPQNILLDDTYVAKLADFGLSRLMQRDMSEVVTGVRGTPGYIAPEWLSHGAVSKKSDIYSMGMVLLEIVGGRKILDMGRLSSESDEWHFPSWAAKKCEQGLMLELVDKRMEQAYDREQACRLIHMAFWCIHENPSRRPSASTVVQWLEGSGFITEPPFSTIAQFTQSSPEVTSL